MDTDETQIMNTNMNASDFINAVDHAAGMNDRWLFLAAFCLLLVGCGLVIYWLVRQLQAVIADHKELRNEHHAALAEIAAQNETAMKLAVCLDRNSEALRECAFELRRFQEGKN
jgi:type VI protein secretion system component VasK